MNEQNPHRPALDHSDELLEACRQEETYRSYHDALRWQHLLNKADPSLFKTTLSIAVGGNCNASFLVPGLCLGLAAEGIAARIVDLPYDGWIGSSLSGTVDADILLLWLSSLGASAGGVERRELDTDGILAGVTAGLEKGQRFYAILPEALEGAQDGFSPFAAWQRELYRAIDSALPAEVVRIDPSHVHRKVGDSAWYDGRYWSMAKIPCHPDAATRLGQYTAVVIARSFSPRIKAVAVDLDNTLWSGIVGEIGVDGLDLDPQGEARPFLQMQRFLKDLSTKGVALSVVSKNNMADAIKPFTERPEMILKRDDFIYFHAGWNNKFEAIQKIADNLNIGMDTICLIDDSIHERAEAKSFLPSLMVPDLPEDPELRVGFLAGSGLFTIPVVSGEDRARTEYYRSQAQRQELSTRIDDYPAYLRSLEMVLTANRVAKENLNRVTSLVHKTNQFNLTTRRHSEADIASLAANPDNYAYCYSLTDRFGDAGIIAVLLAVPEGKGMTIDTWLLSCRVIGRSVEDAIFDHLLQWCAARGIRELGAAYFPTAKNAVVEELYDRLGLTRTKEDDQGRYYQGAGLAPVPHSIEIREGSADQETKDS